MRDSMIQLYRPSPPGEIIDSQYGMIPVLEWLHREKERIEKADGRVAEIVHFPHANKCWLLVNNIIKSKYERRLENEVRDS